MEKKSMSVEIRVPELGESIVDAVVGTWMKHEGDAVQQGDALVELETDKVNLEVSAEQSGVLQKILKQEGDVVTVGEVLGLIGESVGAAASQAAPPAASSRVATSTPAPAGVGEQKTPTGALSSAPVDGQRPPSPLARRIAAEHHIDLSQVQGNSPHGRITRDDVLHYMEQQAQPPAQPVPAALRASAQTQPQTAVQPMPAVPTAQTAPTPLPLTQAEQTGRAERIRLSRRRQTIAQRLVETQHTAAMLTTFNEIDMSAVIDLRNRRKEAFKERHDV